MENRILGNEELGSDLKVSAIGLGCMGFSHAYGAATDEDVAIKMIRSAHEMGYTMFDTAEVYGTQDDPHANEVLVGKALAPVRDEVQVVSKFGIHFDYSDGKVNHGLVPDSRPETIRKSIEGTLQRLGTDHLDLYFQHRIDPKVEPETVAQTMGELIAEGKILHWGISEANEEYLRRAHAVTPVTAIENRYSMMARWHEALFPTLEELGVGYVAFSPLANGFLTGTVRKADLEKIKNNPGDYRAAMPQYTAEAIDENQALIDLVSSTAVRHGATDAQVSLAWMLCKKPYIVPIPGSRKESRLRENAGAADVKLSADEVAALDRALDDMDMSAVFGGSTVEK